MSGVEFEIDESVLKGLQKVLGVGEQKTPELAEAVATKRFNGYIVLKGFSPDVVGSISDELKLRIQAARLGTNVRIIIDMQA